MEQLGRGHLALRRVRALRRDAALRRDEGVYLAEGLHLATEALACQAPIEEVFVSPRLTERPEGRALAAQIEQQQLHCRMTTDATLDSLQDTRSPQPILLVVRRPDSSLHRTVAAGGSRALLTVACSVQDPGNLGAMIRSTDAAGGSGFVVTGTGADLFHPRTVRASMGSIFRLPSIEADLDELIPLLQAERIVSLGTDPQRGAPHFSTDLCRPTAFLLGGEAGGLPAELRARLDGMVRVAMRDGVNSLSVGAAAAVLLFEAARQRAAV